MSVLNIPRRLAQSIPQATLRGDLHALAIMVRACAVGSGCALVAAVGADVHLIADRRPLAQIVRDKAPHTIIGRYDYRASASDILADLQFAAECIGKAAA